MRVESGTAHHAKFKYKFINSTSPLQSINKSVEPIAIKMCSGHYSWSQLHLVPSPILAILFVNGLKISR